MKTITTKTNVPPGNQIKIIPGTNGPVGAISFINKRSDTPLQPLVEATYFVESKKLTVSAVVFIDSSFTGVNFSVYQDYVTGADNPCQLYVAYDDSETCAEKFNAYQVNFDIDPNYTNGIKLENISTIETFLWDEDPKASRGTVTNVQRH